MEQYRLSVEDLKDEDFGEFNYKNKMIVVNYYQMYKCYNDVIAPVLKRVLDETKGSVSDIDNVNVVLVGGFCNFYLVKKQVYDYFRIVENDKRLEGIIKEESQREKAIAHGAALFANEVIKLCNVAHFSIGTYAKYPDGRRFNRYAINYGQEIKTDEIYFARDDNGTPYPTTSGSIGQFLLNFTNRESMAIDMKPKEEFERKLESISCGLVIVVGFSIDADDRVSVHIYNYDMNRGKMEDKPTASVKLTTMKDMFASIVLEL